MENPNTDTVQTWRREHNLGEGGGFVVGATVKTRNDTGIWTEPTVELSEGRLVFRNNPDPLN